MLRESSLNRTSESQEQLVSADFGQWREKFGCNFEGQDQKVGRDRYSKDLVQR